MTVWYNACKYPVVQVSWCLLYFSQAEARAGDKKFMSRMCEFFVIDKSETFHIFNMSKNLNKPAHAIDFAGKHQSMPDSAEHCKIS